MLDTYIKLPHWVELRTIIATEFFCEFFEGVLRRSVGIKSSLGQGRCSVLGRVALTTGTQGPIFSGGFMEIFVQKRFKIMKVCAA